MSNKGASHHTHSFGQSRPNKDVSCRVSFSFLAVGSVNFSLACVEQWSYK
jgi:hypothetical protein